MIGAAEPDPDRSCLNGAGRFRSASEPTTLGKSGPKPTCPGAPSWLPYSNATTSSIADELAGPLVTPYRTNGHTDVHGGDPHGDSHARLGAPEPPSARSTGQAGRGPTSGNHDASAAPARILAAARVSPPSVRGLERRASGAAIRAEQDHHIGETECALVMAGQIGHEAFEWRGLRLLI